MITRLEDNILEEISGGAGNMYEMDNDPLYQKFMSFWNNREEVKNNGSGMESRMEFMNAFQKWVKDGVPENISGWYKSFSGS